MRNAKLFSGLGAMLLVAGAFLISGPAHAGSWSVNIGIPVVMAAPPPAVVYGPPAVPVVTVVPSTPVISPYVSGYVGARYTSRHYYRGRYRGGPRYHHGRW